MSKFIGMKAVMAVGLLAVSLMATACNTVEGAGKDTKVLGQNIQDTARDAK